MNKARQSMGTRARPGSGYALTGGSCVASVTDRVTMTSNDELLQLVRAVATRADRQAFAVLFKHFAPRVKGYLVGSGSSAMLAEELTQETMVILWRKAESFDPRRAGLSTWIFTIARNLRIDHYRKELLRDGAEQTEDWDADQQPADARAAPDDFLLLAQRAQRLRTALQALPDDQLRALRLSYFEDQAHSRIAQELGVPLGTVKSRIRLAVNQLRRLLDGIDS